MKKLKESVSTRTKVKVIRAIESGIRMQSVAETLGLSLDKVKEIRKRANADIKAEIGELEQYGSVQALVDRIEQYVEYYNERRIQLRLDGMSPSEYRRSRMCAGTI